MSYKGFQQVELTRPGRSTFNLSHEKRLSTRMGKLTPLLCTEVMPNDTFRISVETLIKLAPLLAPIFHRTSLYWHAFFIPNRLLWKDWEPFITGGRLGETVQDPPIPPRFTINSILAANENLLNLGSMSDYLGIPHEPDSNAPLWTGTRSIDVMPFAAVYRAWYDWYRDRNYVADNELLPLASGTQPTDVLEIMRTKYRSWEQDYYTSALPWTQRGAEVLMPLQGSGTVSYLPTSRLYDQNGNPFNTGSTDIGGGVFSDEIGGAPTGTIAGKRFEDGITYNARIENIDEVEITNSSVSINDLRRANMLQVWLERNALAGSRYNESIQAHFGRKTSDARLQRAEYIGGNRAVIQISEVLTTAFSNDADDNTVPPASMTGRGSSFSKGNNITYNSEEHGFIVIMMSVMPTSAYMQGLPRMFQQRNTFLDYPWPSFAHLGEQEVYNNELYFDPASTPSDRTTQPIFGYQSRYADWKQIQSSTHGDFRTSLDFWHITRKFASQPVLGNQFTIFEDSLQNRIFAVEDVDTLWLYVYNRVTVKRALPYYGTPQL